jgi:hypothetical protein
MRFCATRSRLFWIVLLPALAAAGAGAQEIACSDCHEETVTSPMHLDFACSDCHSDVDLDTHPDVSVELSTQVLCATCHDASDATAASVHVDLGCGDCHGPAHDVLPVDDAQAPTSAPNQVTTCGTCHDSEDVLDAYLGSVHAKALLRSGLTEAAPSCSDCHGSHAILSADQEDS